MRQKRQLYAIVGMVLIGCIPAVAQERGFWRASNSAALSITGDITLSDEKLSINFSGFPIARIRPLEAREASAVFETDSSAAGGGSLYRVSISGSIKFMHKNSLCGEEVTQWMAAYVQGGTLHLAFFSGQKEPVFSPEAIMNTTDLCGTFSYVR